MMSEQAKQVTPEEIACVAGLLARAYPYIRQQKAADPGETHSSAASGHVGARARDLPADAHLRAVRDLPMLSLSGENRAHAARGGSHYDYRRQEGRLTGKRMFRIIIFRGNFYTESRKSSPLAEFPLKNTNKARQ